MMPTRIVATLLFHAALFTALPAQEAATPMDVLLQEGKTTLITCELKEDTALAAYPSYKAGKGTYTYKLYIPQGYYSQPERRYPALFVMAPGGNAGMKMDLNRAKKEGWIGVMFMEARNGPWEPILGNMLAAHTDVMQRVRIREGLKFATGFSGGARGSSLLVQMCPGFAGLFLQGAGFSFNDNNSYNSRELKSIQPFSVFMSMGEQDSNFSEVERVRKELPDSIPFKAATFPGGHTGATAEIWDQGLDWMLLQTLSKADFPAEGPLLFESVLERVLEAPDSASKLEQMDLLAALGKKMGLEQDPVRGARLKVVEESAKTLRSSPELSKILQAEEAMKGAAEKETEELENLRPDADAKKKKKVYAKLNEMFTRLAEEHAGTPSAVAAKSKVEEYLKKSAKLVD